MGEYLRQAAGLHLSPLAGRGIGRLRRPCLKRTPKQSFGYVASQDAIRVRGWLSRIQCRHAFADSGPSPQPSPRKRGERELS
jgi:hypothetical protein